MTYKQAQEHSLTVPWRTFECSTPDCWCRGVGPVDPIEDEDGNDVFIIPSGVVTKECAEHIVELHNKSL